MEQQSANASDPGTGNDEMPIHEKPLVEVADKKLEQLKLHFLAVGGAPILKKNKFQVRENMLVSEMLVFLRRTLKIRDGDPIFLYINSAFAPSLDQALRSLYESFQVNGELVLQYAITSSWG
jgi:ubiquitin-like protein ATG12